MHQLQAPAPCTMHHRHGTATCTSSMHEHHARAPCTSTMVNANHQATYFIRKGDYETSLKFISQAVVLCR